MSLARQIFDAGVIGAGGAGFPTYKKLADGVNLLVINAVECEPLLGSDRYLMRHRADEIIVGASAVAEALGVERVVIGTKAHYHAEIAALRAAMDKAKVSMDIHQLQSFFPAGDEQVLVYEITGKTVPLGGLPLDLGVVVINATTAANISRAIQGRPVTRRLVTVTGEVAHPMIVDAPVGTMATDLIAAAGGTTVGEWVIIKGGPMMGKLHPMNQASDLGFGKADGALIVLPADHLLAQRASVGVAHLLTQTQSMCIQCRMCTDMCPRYLIGHRMRPHMVMRSLQSGVDSDGLNDALGCCECGVCEMWACPMGLSPRRMNVYVKGLLRAQGAVITDRVVHPEQSVERDHRRIATSRLIERLGLGAYPTQIDDMVRLEPHRVKLATRHGVGMASRPCVAVGDRVSLGDPVAVVEYGEVGANVHASVNGRVTEVETSHVIIEEDRS